MSGKKAFLLFIAFLMLVGFTPIMQGIERFKEIRAETVKVEKNLTVTGDVAVTGNFTDHNAFLRYQDVDAAPDVFAQATAAATVVALPTGEFLGIEYPRNLKVTYTTATTSTAGDLTVTGTNMLNQSDTEVIAVSAVSGTQTLVGNVAWKSIATITLPSSRSEAIDITIVGGQKFGLPRIPVVAGDVYHVTVNKTPQAAPTVNTTYGTFDPVSTPAADVDYNVWMKQ